MSTRYKLIAMAIAPLTLLLGTLAMANSGPNSGGSQFFFVYNDSFKLEPTYAAFGTADKKGIKVLAKIGKIPTVANEAGDKVKPKDKIVVQSLTVGDAVADGGPAPGPSSSQS